MKYRSWSLWARTCEMPSLSIVILAASCRPARGCGLPAFGSAEKAALLKNSAIANAISRGMVILPVVIGTLALTLWCANPVGLGCAVLLRACGLRLLPPEKACQSRYASAHA